MTSAVAVKHPAKWGGSQLNAHNPKYAIAKKGPSTPIRTREQPYTRIKKCDGERFLNSKKRALACQMNSTVNVTAVRRTATFTI